MLNNLVSLGLGLASDILGVCHEHKAQAIVEAINSYIPTTL